jgi:hypothetical protein
MGHDNLVFCLCCQTDILRSRKREHRQTLNTPYATPILPPSLQKPITESDLDSGEDNLPSPSGEGSNEVHDSVEDEADNKMARLDNNIGYIAFEGKEDIFDEEDLLSQC